MIDLLATDKVNRLASAISTTIISWVEGQSFGIKTMLFPWATGSVSNSNLANSAVPWFGRLFFQWILSQLLDRGNNAVLTSKPCHQTSPCLTQMKTIVHEITAFVHNHGCLDFWYNVYLLVESAA